MTRRYAELDAESGDQIQQLQDSLLLSEGVILHLEHERAAVAERHFDERRKLEEEVRDLEERCHPAPVDPAGLRRRVLDPENEFRHPHSCNEACRYCILERALERMDDE